MLSQRLFDGDNHMHRESVTVEQAQADFAKRKAQADHNRSEIEMWNREHTYIGIAAHCATDLRKWNAELDA